MEWKANATRSVDDVLLDSSSGYFWEFLVHDCVVVLQAVSLMVCSYSRTRQQGSQQFYCSELTNPNVGISKIKKTPAGLEANLSKLYVDHMEWPSSCDRTMGAAGSPCAGNE